MLSSLKPCAVRRAFSILLISAATLRAAEPGYSIDTYNPALAYNGTTLFTDNHGSDLRVLQFDMEGNKVWEYIVPTNLYNKSGPGFDAELLTNGNILLVLPATGVFEVNREGSVIWSNLDDRISHDADRLPDGNTLYVYGDEDNPSNSIVKEVTSTGSRIWEYCASNEYSCNPYFPYSNIYRQGWIHCNSAVRMTNGWTLVSPRNLNKTIIVDTNEQTVWSMDYSNLYPSVDFPIGSDPHEPEFTCGYSNILVCMQWDTPVQAVEYERATSNIVWEYSRSYLRTTRDADRLPNGNTLLVGVLTQIHHSVIFEVTPESNIVWQLRLTNSSAENEPGWFFKAQRVEDFDQDGYQDSIDNDDDNDGMLDADEAVAGTSPKDSSDYFKIDTCDWLPVNQANTISWTSVIGRVYRIYTNCSILQSWSSNYIYESTGTGSTITYTNIPPETNYLYYKLGVEL